MSKYKLLFSRTIIEHHEEMIDADSDADAMEYAHMYYEENRLLPIKKYFIYRGHNLKYKSMHRINEDGSFDFIPFKKMGNTDMTKSLWINPSNRKQ